MDVIPCAMFRTPAHLTTQALPFTSRAPRAGGILSEIFPAAGAETAAAGFVLTQIGTRAGPVLWIQDRLAQCETGRPFLAGLGCHRSLMLMQLSRPVDVMAAVEEGLRCKVLAAVVAEIRGNPTALSFNAMKRLALRAGAGGVPCWLIRQSATVDLSAARDRWRIATLPSLANPDDARAPGNPRWRVELFRSRDGRPGEWVAQYERARSDGTQDRLDLAAAVPDGALAKGAATGG